MMRTISSVFCFALMTLSTVGASAAGIRGDYVEARTADVFTGPCFSNAEVFITGKEAVMAWKVTSGSWKGVDLAGLCVAAAVNGSTTFSEDKPEKAAAVLIVDSKANSQERVALIDMAKTLGGARLDRVSVVTTARMSSNWKITPAQPIRFNMPPMGCRNLLAPHSGRPGSPRLSRVLWMNGTMRAATKWSLILPYRSRSTFSRPTLLVTASRARA